MTTSVLVLFMWPPLDTSILPMHTRFIGPNPKLSPVVFVLYSPGVKTLLCIRIGVTPAFIKSWSTSTSWNAALINTLKYYLFLEGMVIELFPLMLLTQQYPFASIYFKELFYVLHNNRCMLLAVTVIKVPPKTTLLCDCVCTSASRQLHLLLINL